MKCDGNALECTVHHSPWEVTATHPMATRCTHIALAGREHVHNPDGTRTHRGDAQGDDLAAVMPCTCTELPPIDPLRPIYVPRRPL